MKFECRFPGILAKKKINHTVRWWFSHFSNHMGGIIWGEPGKLQHEFQLAPIEFHRRPAPWN